MSVLYFANPTGPVALQAMVDGLIGFIDTPAQGNKRPPGVVWCADNGAYSDKFDEARWWAFLTRHAVDTRLCRFATAPDVVGDATATLARSEPWFGPMRDLGYPVALVAQNGLEDLAVPWCAIDALFLGGDDEWKLGAAARALALEARRRGKWVHMGRVNSGKRFAYARAIGCQSVDGTALVFHPRDRLKEVLAWTRGNDQLALFDHSGT